MNPQSLRFNDLIADRGVEVHHRAQRAAGLRQHEWLLRAGAS